MAELIYADKLGLSVTYIGVSAQGQHMFSNGQHPNVTDLFDKMDDAVARFGRRIELNEDVVKFSMPGRAGFHDGKAGIYRPVRMAEDHPASTQIELLEYGIGYLSALLAK